MHPLNREDVLHLRARGAEEVTMVADSSGRVDVHGVVKRDDDRVNQGPSLSHVKPPRANRRFENRPAKRNRCLWFRKVRH